MDWTKFDAPPVIPVFSVLAAAGVSFMDKTVRVETLADAIVAGIEGGRGPRDGVVGGGIAGDGPVSAHDLVHARMSGVHVEEEA